MPTNRLGQAQEVAGERRPSTFAAQPAALAKSPEVAAGAYRITFGGQHGATIARRGGPPLLAPFSRPQGLRLHPSVRSKVAGVRALDQAATAVWTVLHNGASNVRIDAASGAGATTLLDRLAGRAQEHGFTDGALRLTDVIGPGADLCARLTAQLPHEPMQSARLHALILLDRAELTAVDLSTLCELLPSCRFVLVQPNALADTTVVKLCPLDVDEIATLLADACQRNIDDDNRPVAIDICRTIDMRPGPARLVGVAARELGRSFISLRLGFGNADAIAQALIASRSSNEKRMLAGLAFAGMPLCAPQIAYITGGTELPGCLARLVACELIRLNDDGLYEVPEFVVPKVLVLAEADALLGRLSDVISAALDASSTAPLLDCQLLGAEVLLRTAFRLSHWARVMNLGLRMAEAFALRDMSGAWGRVLGLVEIAATRADDAVVLGRARHDLGVRSIVAGDFSRAAAYLTAAIGDRHRAGDDDGAAATTAVLGFNEEQRARFGAVEAAPEATAPPARAAETLPGQPPPQQRVQKKSAPIGRLQASGITTRYAPALEPARRIPTQRPLLLFALAIAALAVLAFTLWPRSTETALAITHVSVRPATISAGARTELCVEAADAAVVEVFPDAARLPGTGRNCVVVHPAVTTTYIAVATSLDGRQVRGNATVRVSAPADPQPRIAMFTASPARIAAGQTTQLCYAVSGARLVRMVPSTGSLSSQRSCTTVTLQEPHGYTYRLFATSDSGAVVQRETRVDVIAAPPVIAAPLVHHAVDAHVVQQGAEQFNAMQAAVAKPASRPVLAQTGDIAVPHAEWEIDEANRWDGTMVWHGDVVAANGGTIVLDVRKKSIAGRSASPCERRTDLHAALAAGVERQTVPFQETNCQGTTSSGEVRVVDFSRNGRSFRGSFWESGVKLGDFDARKL